MIGKIFRVICKRDKYQRLERHMQRLTQTEQVFLPIYLGKLSYLNLNLSKKLGRVFGQHGIEFRYLPSTPENYVFLI